jgi:hypothetical protein
VARLDDITAPAYLEDLETWPLAQVRARRDETNEVETGLSYLRRLIQGRLDIVLAERRRRQEGGAAVEIGQLVERLPEILGDKVHAPGHGRLSALMGPGELDPELEARLESALPGARLGTLEDLDDAALEGAFTALDELQRSVSQDRRAVCDVEDKLQEELVRRYRSGEASVDSLLS